MPALQGYAHYRSAGGTFADDALAGALWHSLCAGLGGLGRVDLGANAKDPEASAPGSFSVWAVPVGRAGRPAVQINCAAGAYLKSGALMLLLWPMRTCE